MSLPLAHIYPRIAGAGGVWLFLDYDGTLADFAPTPDHIEPQPDVIGLVSQLAAHLRIRVAMVSGRRLDHLETLVPVPAAVLAGTYGVEIRELDGSRHLRVADEDYLPQLGRLKAQWDQLLVGRGGFYLEDKGWAVALHARFAEDSEASEVIAAARRVAVDSMDLSAVRILDGHKFIEVGPQAADKGQAVEYLLRRYPLKNAIPVYLGDDDKDEKAFRAVKVHGGMAILVSKAPRESEALFRLETPRAVHTWLRGLLAAL